MRKRLRQLVLAVPLAAIAMPAFADCYADYRARKDDPFGLHYGVISLPQSTCSMSQAPAEVAARISAEGWELLQVISVFDENGIAERRADAGEFFLRY